MSEFQDNITDSAPQPRRNESPERPHSQTAQRIDYTFKLEEILAFAHYHGKHWANRPGQPGHLGWFFPIFLGLIGFAGLAKYLCDPAPYPNSLVDWIVLLMFLFYIFVLAFWVFVMFFGGKIRDYRLRRQFCSNPRYSDRRVLAISEEGVTGGDQSATMTVLWHAVVRIIEDGDLAYIYISAGDAFVLPERAFADGQQFKQFMDTARRYHAEARRFVKPEGPA